MASGKLHLISERPDKADNTQSIFPMMAPSDTILGVSLTSQFCIGVTGNLLLFMSYVHAFFTRRNLKPIDLIFVQLTVFNMLTIAFTLVPDMAFSFGIRRLLNDAGCKAVLYIFRVTRGMSICTTSLLSTFQAVTISPGNSKWAWLKPKLSTWTFPFFLFSWVINMLIYIHVIRTVISASNATRVGCEYFHAFCETRILENKNKGFYFSIIWTRDLLFVALMTWTSLYMVTLLYRHHRRAQHVHNPSLSSQTSPETKATQTILLLVSCFVFFYWLNNVVTLYGFYIPVKIPRLEAISAILSSCYPTICPFLLMKNNKIILQFISSLSVLRIACFQRSVSG